MQCAGVVGKSAARPGGRISAVKAEGIAIISVDVDSAYACSGCIVSVRMGIIVDQRHNNTSIASLVLDILHIVTIGEIHSAASTGVFVLGLVEDDRTAVGDLVFGDGLRDVSDVTKLDINNGLLSTSLTP